MKLPFKRDDRYVLFAQWVVLGTIVATAALLRHRHEHAQQPQGARRFLKRCG